MAYVNDSHFAFGDSDPDGDAEKAFASIQEQIGLDQWTSSRLGSLPIGGFQKNPEEWLFDDDGEDDSADIFMETIDEPPPPSTTKASRKLMVHDSTPLIKRNPRRALQRATTPVIDNTSPAAPTNINLASPWPQKQIILKSNPSLTSRSSHTEYKRYYDALVHFKRTAQDEVFLKTLNYACWERADDNRQLKEDSLVEGNFWRLLCCFHQLDPTMVVWDAASSPSSSHDRFLQDLAQKYMHLTPANIIALFWDQAPLSLKRRRTIMHWLETCFDNVLPADAERRVPNRRLASKNPLQEALGMYETEQDGRIFRSALALILAGRLEDAKALATDMDAAWRARLWSGGEPFGMTIENSLTYESHGNPHRAMWRSILFRMAQDDVKDPNFAAIIALLSSNFKRAIDNEALRSWDKALYAACKCSLDRTEDLLLHYQNSHRRSTAVCPPYPGQEHLDSERDHLDATSDIAQMDEKTAIEIIKAAPFDAMHPDDLLSDAICSFILGKHTFYSLLEECVRYLKEIMEKAVEFESLLRFVVHVAIYLDMKLGPQNELSALKEELILMYLNQLSTREDLWYMSVLYATFLPCHLILAKLPGLLLDTENQSERKQIVCELQEFLPEETVVDILRATVELSFEETDEYADDFAPTGTDKYKMRSIYWLCFEQSHMAEALIAANTLLRNFLLHGNKEESAIMLMDVSLPPDLETSVNTLQMEDSSPLVENALLEYSSFSAYLRGMKLVAKWKKTIMNEGNDPSSEMLALLDKHQFSDFERNIVRSQHNRNIVESKRECCQKIVNAATEAQRGLLEVLRHPGGLLSTIDDTIVDGEDQRVRRIELSKLRLELIPKTIQLYHDVCTKTASALFEILAEIAALVANNDSSLLVDSLHEIDDASSENDAAASLLVNSSISPLFWTQKALDIIIEIQDDTTGLRTNLRSIEYFTLLHNLQRGALTLHKEYAHSMLATSAAITE